MVYTFDNQSIEEINPVRTANTKATIYSKQYFVAFFVNNQPLTFRLLPLLPALVNLFFSYIVL